MWARTLPVPSSSTAVFEGASRIAGFIRDLVEAVYEAAFRKVLRAIARTI
jgi:hypothetical protein